MIYNRASTIKLLLVIALLLAATLISPLIGPASFSSAENSLDFEILWQLRFPRVATAFLTGASLALAGLIFQSLFQNPLASPFTLGVASGASLGASIAIAFGIAGEVFGISGITFCALGGALVATAIVFTVAKSRLRFSSTLLLLTGVALSFFFSSLILFVQYYSDITDSFRLVRWLMGGVDVLDTRTPLVIFIAFTIFLLASVFHLKELDICSIEDELAISRGVDIAKVRVTLFLFASICVGVVVSFTGPIGFVGIIAPHIGRLLLGASHARVLPMTLLVGGSLLAICDTFARTAFAPAELPVGVITALLGGPFFLWILLSSRDRA